MSYLTANDILETAPIGAVIHFSDGTERPSARFKNKVERWEERNGTGRLTNKRASMREFILRADVNLDSTRSVLFTKAYGHLSPLRFEIIGEPKPKAFLVISNDNAVEMRALVHIAPDLESALNWIKRDGSKDVTVVRVPEPHSAIAAE
jgi:hypothetical protein